MVLGKRQGRRASGVLRLVCLLVMAAALGAAVWGVLGCSWHGAESEADSATTVDADEPAEPAVELARPLAAFPSGVAAAGVAWQQQFHDMVVARVVEIALPERDPLRFDDWTATDDIGATEADADGLLTRWQVDWYVTHEWSQFGRQILTMAAGDTVVVNGRELLVDGAFDYPKDSTSDEINELIGLDSVVLQTCEPGSNLNRIVYGHWVS